jgi:hypothetical protein
MRKEYFRNKITSKRLRSPKSLKLTFPDFFMGFLTRVPKSNPRSIQQLELNLVTAIFSITAVTVTLVFRAMAKWLIHLYKVTDCSSWQMSVVNCKNCSLYHLAEWRVLFQFIFRIWLDVLIDIALFRLFKMLYSSYWTRFALNETAHCHAFLPHSFVAEDILPNFTKRHVYPPRPKLVRLESIFNK